MLVIDLRKKTSKELIIIEEKSRAELFALRFQLALGNLEKTHKIKKLRILIARILTILSERKLKGEKINRHFKVDLSKNFKEIEKETKRMILKRKNKLINTNKKLQNDDLVSKDQEILKNLSNIENKEAKKIVLEPIKKNENESKTKEITKENKK